MRQRPINATTTPASIGRHHVLTTRLRGSVCIARMGTVYIENRRRLAMPAKLHNILSSDISNPVPQIASLMSPGPDWALVSDLAG